MTGDFHISLLAAAVQGDSAGLILHVDISMVLSKILYHFRVAHHSSPVQCCPAKTWDLDMNFLYKRSEIHCEIVIFLKLFIARTPFVKKKNLKTEPL